MLYHLLFVLIRDGHFKLKYYVIVIWNYSTITGRSSLHLEVSSYFEAENDGKYSFSDKTIVA